MSETTSDGVVELMVRKKLPKTESFFQRALTRVFRFIDITKDSELYLRRWLLLKHPWGLVYLHRIPMEDKDPDPHDHPWPCRIVILKGGYEEHYWPDPMDREGYVSRACPPGSTRKIAAEFTHKIVRHFTEETWSLVFCGGYKKTWGFWTEIGWVDFRTYLGKDVSTRPNGKFELLEGTEPDQKWDPMAVDDHVCYPVRGPKNGKNN